MRKRAAGQGPRFATAAFLAVALPLTAAAPDLEIPQKLLDHESRVRASFTPAQRSRQAALEARVSSKMSVRQVLGLMEGSSDSGEIMACLMKYLKDCQKEAKENRNLADAFAKQRLTEKVSKLEQDNARIAASMQEAKEKADIAMNAATTGMIVGIAQGLIQVGAAAASHAGSGAGAASAASGKAPATSGVRAPGTAAAPGLVVPTRTPTRTPLPAAKAP
jgi:hypothetical protein